MCKERGEVEACFALTPVLVIGLAAWSCGTGAGGWGAGV